MKKFLLLFVLLSFGKHSFSQNLNGLNLLRTAGTVDYADNVLTQLGYHFLQSKNSTVDTIHLVTTYFRKMSENIDSDAIVTLTKEVTSEFRLFQVQLITHSIKRFNDLKEECESLKNCKLINEKTGSNGSYERHFSDGLTNYYFSIFPPSKKGDIAMYIVFIKS